MAKKALTAQYIGISNRKFCRFSLNEVIYIVCVTILCCGVEFGYDVPGSLQVIMMKNYNLTNSQYSLFYSVYALPNIFLCFFGGFLIDGALGIRTSTILYMMIALSGTSLFAFGGYIDIFWVMLLGRLFFGLGSEMGSGVCLNYLTFNRFKNTNVNLVFSVSDNFGYIGTMAVYQVSSRLYEYFKESHSGKKALNIVLMITSSMFLVSTACGILMIYLKPRNDMAVLPQHDVEENNEKKEEISSQHIAVKLTDFTKFPPMFWLLCLTSACFHNAVYTFESFSQGLMTNEYNLTVDDANDVTFVLNLTKVVFSIPLSMIVDKTGRNTLFVLLAVFIAIAAHSCLLMRVNPYVCIIMLGMSYTTMGSSIVPMFAYPLSKHHYGICYGVASSFYNLSLFICPLMAGKIIDTYGYHKAELFYLSSLAIAVLCITQVWILDKKSGGILIMTPEERIVHEQRKLEIKGHIDIESKENLQG